MNLEPIDPETAVELYLADKQNELATASLKTHENRISHFVRGCDLEALANLNTLTGRALHKYRLWRREEGDLNKVSEKTQMDTIRVFVRWLESIDAVEQDLSEKVRSPSITPGENSRDMVNIYDTEGNILDPNPTLCEETGYDEEELADTKVWELDQAINPDEARTLWKGMDHGDRERLEGIYQRCDGSDFPVEVHIRRLDMDGKDHYMVSSREITERKKYERQLQTGIDEFRHLNKAQRFYAASIPGYPHLNLLFNGRHRE